MQTTILRIKLTIWQFRRRSRTATRGIGNMVGGLLGAGRGDNQNPSHEQQRKKKGGLGDMLGL